MTNDNNLRKRYANYQRLTELRRGRNKTRERQGAAQKWIRNPGDLDTYIKLVQANDTVVDNISEIDPNRDVLKDYEVETYVLWRYHSTKIV